MPIALSPVDEALQHLSQGKMVVLVEDDNGEGEADLCLGAESTTPDGVNFMATHGRGLICLALTEEKNPRVGNPYAGTGT